MTWFKNLRELLGMQKNPHCLCMVVSEQEGAEIWIDGQPTGLLTPHLISLPQNQDVQLTIKLIGHNDHTVFIRSTHDRTYYHCNLTRIPLRLIHNENDIPTSL